MAIEVGKREWRSSRRTCDDFPRSSWNRRRDSMSRADLTASIATLLAVLLFPEVAVARSNVAVKALLTAEVEEILSVDG
jgi:hypothetical protein